MLFSSGTIGVPKGIVDGHGGVLLNHLRVLRLHSDLRAGDRFLNVASSGWVVWTCRAALSRVREPRRVLPSTAIDRLDPGAGGEPDPIAGVSRSGSMVWSSLRIIASDGRRSTSMPSST